jgi:hypothetical protein
MGTRTRRRMSNHHAPDGTEPGSGTYEIRLAGHLHQRWAAWFDGWAIRHQADGTTVISGLVADQSALHGLLQRVRDLGLALISVTQGGSDLTDQSRLIPTDDS